MNSFFWYLVIFSISYLSQFLLIHGGPIPPRIPYTPQDWRKKSYHLKEDSPVFCSRAVSRWVRDAWNVALKDAFRNEFTVPDNRLLSRNCPFQGDGSTDLYTVQETWKNLQNAPNSYNCKQCFKSFKSEYHLDRHLDRKHTFPEIHLQNNYQGGIPDTLINLRVVNNSEINSPIKERIRRWGFCLEDYCPIFDVCDRPLNKQYPIIRNNQSITYTEPLHVSVSSPIHYGLCIPDKLIEVKEECTHLINTCFPIDSKSKSIRRANIYFHRHLCGALETCQRYITRRQYAGSPKHYTEAAYTGSLVKPFSAIPGWQIALFVVASLSVIFIAIAVVCCILESHDTPIPERHTRGNNYVYRSGSDRPIPTRRKGGGGMYSGIDPGGRKPVQTPITREHPNNSTLSYAEPTTELSSNPIIPNSQELPSQTMTAAQSLHDTGQTIPNSMPYNGTYTNGGTFLPNQYAYLNGHVQQEPKSHPVETIQEPENMQQQNMFSGIQNTFHYNMKENKNQ